MTVSLLSYGLGNLGSVANMFKRIGTEVRVISSPDEIMASERVLVPGIGAFDHGMARLNDQDLVRPLQEFAATGRPLLGICLGMQLLADSSEEGESAGLGLIPGRSRKFTPDAGLRIPHMGWNGIVPAHADSLIDGVQDGRFYFVHSYHVEVESQEHALAYSDYGVQFVSMLRSGNVMGAQFHPEKSHAFGMTVLSNFAKL